MRESNLKLVNTEPILWKASAQRLDLIKQYEKWTYSYTRGRTNFKSKKQEEKEEIDKLNKAIRFRINGHEFKTGHNSPFRRIGSLQINDHAVSEVLTIAKKLEVAIYPLFIGKYKKIKVWILRSRERSIAFILRNWINPLHNSLLPEINEALEEAERILKVKQKVIHVWKILFTPEIEKKGQRTLDFQLKNGIKHYSLPYISPETLDSLVKKETGINIRKFYPSKNTWNIGIKELLETFLRSLLHKVKKKTKAIITEGLKWFKREIHNIHYTPSGSSKISTIFQGNKRDLKVLAVKPPPVNDSSYNLLHKKEEKPKKMEVVIKIPENKMKVRIAEFKKRAKNGIVRTYSSLIFYKVREVIEKDPLQIRARKIQKHVIINTKAFRLIYGYKEMLNNCIYALSNYRPKNAFREHERKKYLGFFLKELQKIQV